ncbi:glyoxylate reductase [Acrasis kona]|uniref:Glyoxylate reductase n=1 Tax=Acrasis kona TaxID=1008807 RepID=A0AAW2YQ37_9EUKA
MNKKKVLSFRPLIFLEPYKEKYDIILVEPDSVKEDKNPHQYIIDQINKHKPHAIYLSHFTFQFKEEQSFPHQFINNNLLSKIDKTNLKVIANHGVGYDHIDAQACKDHNVIVTNTPDVLSDATADTAMFLILNVARRFTEFEKRLRDGKWQGTPSVFGVDPKNKTLGIVGLGSIGNKLAERAEAFGMNVIYHNRNKKDVDFEYCNKLEDLLSRSDFVSLNLPFSPQTKHLLDKSKLDHMKKGSYLINTSRGAIVDEQALVDKLKSGDLSGAGLDVFEKEPSIHPDLLTLPNCTLLPHVGSQTSDTRLEMEKLAWDNIDAVLSGNGPITQCNK